MTGGDGGTVGSKYSEGGGGGGYGSGGGGDIASGGSNGADGQGTTSSLKSGLGANSYTVTAEAIPAEAGVLSGGKGGNGGIVVIGYLKDSCTAVWV